MGYGRRRRGDGLVRSHLPCSTVISFTFRWKRAILSGCLMGLVQIDVIRLAILDTIVMI